MAKKAAPKAAKDDGAGAANGPVADKGKADATDAAPVVSMPSAASSVIRCNGYRITILNTEDMFRFELDLTDQPDSVQYHLRITRTNDRTELAQKLLNKLATLWPAYDFHFTADDVTGEITNIV